jgi:hypothetical protein
MKIIMKKNREGVASQNHQNAIRRPKKGDVNIPFPKDVEILSLSYRKCRN